MDLPRSLHIRRDRVNELAASNRGTSMKKLILEEWLSLDGFAVDKDGKLTGRRPRPTKRSLPSG
jgi:hypothetical protein